MRGPRPKNYTRWTSAKARCYNSSNKQYHNYGGRGIRMSDEWLNNSASFMEYVSNLPNANKPGLSLDRIDNDGNYERGNLKWSSTHEQTTNAGLRLDNKSGFRCVFPHYSRWQSYIQNNKKKIHMGTFDTPIEAHRARARYIKDNNLLHTP